MKLLITTIVLFVLLSLSASAQNLIINSNSPSSWTNLYCTLSTSNGYVKATSQSSPTSSQWPLGKPIVYQIVDLEPGKHYKYTVTGYSGYSEKHLGIALGPTPDYTDNRYTYTSVPYNIPTTVTNSFQATSSSAYFFFYMTTGLTGKTYYFKDVSLVKREPTLESSQIGEIFATAVEVNGSLKYFGDSYTELTSYGICYSSTNNTPNLNDLVIVNGTLSTLGSFSSNIDGLQPNTTYYARQYATNSFGTEYGEVISFTTLEFLPDPPIAPTNLIGEAISTTQVQLNWTHNATDNEYYVVERSLDGVTFSEVVNDLPANQEDHLDITVLPDLTYFYRVCARTMNVKSNYSNIVQVNTSTNIGGDCQWECNETMFYLTDKKVGIGTSNALGDYNLFVTEGIRTEKVQVDIAQDNGWSDFVFDKDYQLMPIEHVKEFIEINKHLPDIPSEQQVKDEGINVAEMDALLLQKIEELTLYIIEQDKKIDEQDEKIKEQNQNNQQLQLKLLEIENKINTIVKE